MPIDALDLFLLPESTNTQLVQQLLGPLTDMVIQFGPAVGTVQVSKPKPGPTLTARLDIGQRVNYCPYLLFSRHVHIFSLPKT